MTHNLLTSLVCFYNLECIDVKFGPRWVEKNRTELRKKCNQKCLDMIKRIIKVENDS